jgi:hypothetical protein
MCAFAPQAEGTSDSINVVEQSHELCMCCAALTMYAVLMQESGNAPHADAVLLGYLLGCGARPVEVDHGVKVVGGEAVTRTSPACSAAHLTFRTRVRLVVLPAASNKITVARWSCSRSSERFE